MKTHNHLPDYDPCYESTQRALCDSVCSDIDALEEQLASLQADWDLYNGLYCAAEAVCDSEQLIKLDIMLNTIDARQREIRDDIETLRAEGGYRDE